MLTDAEMIRVEDIKTRFKTIYGSDPAMVLRAPGRVNLIGEHTDYNDGFVLPAAIERSVLIAASPRSDRTVNGYAANYNRSTNFSLDKLEHAAETSDRWSNYMRAMAWTLTGEGMRLQGVNLVVAGDVPLGSGLSSSAAMLVACGLLFSEAAGSRLEPVRLALLAQKAEREFVGVNVGIMDQYISALGKQHNALLIDTRSLTYKAVPLPSEGVSIVIADTNKRRGLVESEYNTRRSECEKAVSILKSFLPSITALRDVSVEEFKQYEHELPEPVRSRARHVITEDARTLQMADALSKGDIELCGKLMNESHESLRQDYAVSCKELDSLVEAARSIPGVYGARMTGAGFGGCTVSLVADEAVPDFEARVPKLYKSATGLDASLLFTGAAEGAGRLL